MNNTTFNIPPIPKLFDYPATGTGIIILVATVLMLIAIKYFDATGGSLAISLIVVFAFIGALVFSFFFNIPNDEITSAIAGGLVASFGAVIAFWLGRPHNKNKE
jgi:hypothetical protein